MDKKKKRLLVIAQYYYPDKSSVAQIYRELCIGLLNEFDITVIASFPCYDGQVPDGYGGRRRFVENVDGVSVVRVPVSSYLKTQKTERVKNILKFFFGAIHAIRELNNFQCVLAMSQPPILCGILGVYAKKKLHSALVYNIQDFNPEQIMAVKYSTNKPLMRLLMALDKWSCRKSNLIITVGRDMQETLKKRFPKSKVPSNKLINNWIDEEEIYPLSKDHPQVQSFRARYGLENKFVIMYSGNIGLYYDLDRLIQLPSRFKDHYDVMFVFVGEGAIRDKLVEYCKQNRLSGSVIFLPYQEKNALIYSLNAADVHWCVNAKGIKGVSCPSKIYGILAAGKPVLGVLEPGSEARLIIEEAQCGLVCDPGDYDEIAEKIEWLLQNKLDDEIAAMGKRGRTYLMNRCTKADAVEKYKTALNGVVE